MDKQIIEYIGIIDSYSDEEIREKFANHPKESTPITRRMTVGEMRFWLILDYINALI